MLKIDDEIASIIMSLLNYDMKTSYAVLRYSCHKLNILTLPFKQLKC